MSPFPYKTVFDAIESSLAAHLKQSITELRSNHSEYLTVEYKERSDNEYFDLLKMIIFYSGFRAVTVANKENVIHHHLPDLQTVATFDLQKLEEILSDKNMIRNRPKIEAVIQNAKMIVEISQEYGSFYQYLESMSPQASFENLMLLKEDLEGRFAYLGGVTAYHFLMDIGLDVLKPDRVILRIFERLGLIESPSQLLKSIIHGRKFAAATGLPLRYIDIIFVTYGQQGDSSIEEDGICLLKSPKCGICGVNNLCRNFHN